MRAALKAAIQYAKDRKVFGAPLIDYPLTQVKIALMAARFAACRSSRMPSAGSSTAAAGAWRRASSSCSRAARPRSSRARRCRSTAAWATPRRRAVSRYFGRRARAVDLRRRRGDARAEGGRAHPAGRGVAPSEPRLFSTSARHRKLGVHCRAARGTDARAVRRRCHSRRHDRRRHRLRPAAADAVGAQPVLDRPQQRQALDRRRPAQSPRAASSCARSSTAPGDDAAACC